MAKTGDSLRDKPRWNLGGMTALVTGGSKGLGLKVIQRSISVTRSSKMRNEAKRSKKAVIQRLIMPTRAIQSSSCSSTPVELLLEPSNRTPARAIQSSSCSRTPVEPSSRAPARAPQSSHPVEHSSRALLLEPSSRALQSSPPVELSSRALQSSSPVEPSSRALQSSTPVEHSSRALQSSTPLEPLEPSSRALQSSSPVELSSRALQSTSPVDLSSRALQSSPPAEPRPRPTSTAHTLDRLKTPDPLDRAPVRPAT